MVYLLVLVDISDNVTVTLDKDTTLIDEIIEIFKNDIQHLSPCRILTSKD